MVRGEACPSSAKVQPSSPTQTLGRAWPVRPPTGPTTGGVELPNTPDWGAKRRLDPEAAGRSILCEVVPQGRLVRLGLFSLADHGLALAARFRAKRLVPANGSGGQRSSASAKSVILNYMTVPLQAALLTRRRDLDLGGYCTAICSRS